MCILHKDKVIESYHLPEELLSEQHRLAENDSGSIDISDEVDFEQIVREKEIELL